MSIYDYYVPVITDYLGFVNDPNGGSRSFLKIGDIMSQAIPLFNVKDYGALGDGITDDTVSIQDTIDAASNAGGGTVYFPRGIYIVKTTNLVTYSGYSTAIILKPNIRLVGEATSLSIIKIADNQPVYKVLIGQNPAVTIDDLEISNLTFDANFTNNVHDGTDLLTQYRMMLHLFRGERIRIHHCRWTNFDNLNCVSINGALDNIHLVDCQFDNYGFVSAWHDASTIYFDANNYLISRNYFEGNAGNAGVGTAIETHGSQQVVTDNILKNVSTGVNVTGVGTTNDNIIIANNVMLNVRWGVKIYSQTSSGSTAGLRNTQITGNMIIQDLDMWFNAGSTPATLYGSGISVGGSWDLPVINLLIANNNIRLLPFTSLTQASDNNGNGINLYDPMPYSAQHSGIKISNNTIDGALSSGIWVALDVVDLDISNNSIRNPGQAPNVNGGYKLGMYIGGSSIRAGRIHDNLVIDTQNPKTTNTGFGLYTTTIIDSTFFRNQVHSTTDAILEMVGTSDVNAAWLLDTAFTTWSAPTGYFKAGSRVLAKDTGVIHIQSSTNSTMSWS